jgi:DNA-binding protein HU-beta
LSKVKIIFDKPLKINQIRMRKADLVVKIAEKTGIAKVDVIVALEEFFSEVKDALAEGDNVYIRGFGSFILKERAEKVGRNIKLDEAVVIPAHSVPSFRPSKSFIDAVKHVTPNPEK